MSAVNMGKKFKGSAEPSRAAGTREARGQRAAVHGDSLLELRVIRDEPAQIGRAGGLREPARHLDGNPVAT